MHDTKNSLPAATREKVVGILNQQLADLTDLYGQTKHAHWNVRGRLFWMLHKLFDQIAETVEANIDPLAERITSLGGFAKGTIRMAAANSKLPEFVDEQPDELSYLRVLIERFATTSNTMRKAVSDTEDLGDHVSADMMTKIVAELDQALWFLEAHVK